MKIGYKLPAKLNRKIGQAMHDFSMFSEGDRVLVAVSGGVDSLTLACVLKIWQSKAPIQFDLTAQYIDHGFWRRQAGAADPVEAIGRQLQRLSQDFEVAEEWAINEGDRTCFLCSRNRRSQLFDLAREKGYNKIALGHHKDDLIETFMLNAVYSGNISTMVPKQDLFGGTLSIVRPMAYLEKYEVCQIAAGLKLEIVKNLCPLSNDTRREKVRNLLQALYQDEPAAKNSLFAALSNVRIDYLL
ncbi:MAG: tRNA 2-thiocytidine biosynthesis protein TtcA [Desulforhopalus sp.]|jgi:tRNA 2-thiocytidine biosynthesis protein TtcA|nr:tRNA 2-thiocytidine biosynthesis protein TtcA [Desulforhopalus sp.]